VLAALARDPEIRNFLFSLGGTMAVLSSELEHAASDLENNLSRYEASVTIARRLEMLPISGGLIDRDPSVMLSLSRNALTMVLQTETLEYAIRPRTAYILSPSMPGSIYDGEIRYTIVHQQFSYDITEWGPLLIFMGMFTPSLIVSWDDALIGALDNAITSTTRLSTHGLDLNMLTSQMSLNQLLSIVGSSLITEIRDNSYHFRMSEDDAVDTRHGATAREYIHLGAGVDDSISMLGSTNVEDYGSDRKLPSPFVSYYRVRSNPFTKFVDSFITAVGNETAQYEAKGRVEHNRRLSSISNRLIDGYGEFIE
jgi:hypothetical protein